MKNIGLIIWSWVSTIGMGLLIFILTIDPNLSVSSDRAVDVFVKVVYTMLLYSILFILMYRAIIITLKSTIERLSKWRSKQEQIEDEEFVLIIETMVVIITILSTILFSIFAQYGEYLVRGANAQPDLKDILVSSIAILLTAIVTYSLPVIGELEVAIKHKVEKVYKNRKKVKEI
ncbi:MAG: hypothetical protein NZZ41_06400 [Candidatus Dojkabacteria bacterium]|nr:hypothetical protein [Candidatus Dojkabacteria bacterium]